jgi:hypothetical protein
MDMSLNSKLIAVSCVTLFGIAALLALPLISTACTRDSRIPKPTNQIVMSNSLNAKIIEDLRTRLGLPNPAAEYLKITKIEAIPISDFDIKSGIYAEPSSAAPVRSLLKQHLPSPLLNPQNSVEYLETLLLSS